MALYRIASTFVDISIGLLLLIAVIRMVITYTYVKRNGNRTLTDEQKKKLKNIIVPIAVLAILFGITSLILFII